MELPNYFLADLPPEASLSPGTVTEACRTLKRNRELYLQQRSTLSLVRVLSEVSAWWLEEDCPFRKLALAADPTTTGFSSATLASGLDAFFKGMTAESLESVLLQEFGHIDRLDGLCATATEREFKRSALVRAPDLLVHIGAGNVPNPTLTSMVFGLLVRSAQFVKCASGASFLPRLFAHSIYQAEPKLGACLEIAEWPGGQSELESALFCEADCVTATGSDETLAAIRQKLPVGLRFLGYGHRVSFGYIAREALSGLQVSRLAARAAADVVAWDQIGCLSPHLIYVESGGRVSGDEFAGMLASQLTREEEVRPRGPRPQELAATVASRRAFYEVRAAHSPDTRQWASPQSTAWTVVYESDPRFQISCLNRFIYVKPVQNLVEALQAADAVRGRVSTVGLAATDEREQELATGLARWGVTRVCPLGQMQNPPLPWRHDGRPALADLVTWTDWERSD